MADFDPVAFSAGIGAGQEAANRATAAAQAEVDRAQRKVEKSGDLMVAGITAAVGMKAEIEQKWIPYGVQMQASIFAARTEKAHLIEALKASDPTNADRIVQESKQLLNEEYARITQPGSEALKKINEEVHRKAEEGRLDR